MILQYSGGSAGSYDVTVHSDHHRKFGTHHGCPQRRRHPPGPRIKLRVTKFWSSVVVGICWSVVDLRSLFRGLVNLSTSFHVDCSHESWLRGPTVLPLVEISRCREASLALRSQSTSPADSGFSWVIDEPACDIFCRGFFCH